MVAPSEVSWDLTVLLFLIKPSAKGKKQTGLRKEVHSRYGHCLLLFIPISAVDHQAEDICLLLYTTLYFSNCMCLACKCENSMWLSGSDIFQPYPAWKLLVSLLVINLEKFWDVFVWLKIIQHGLNNNNHYLLHHHWNPAELTTSSR